MRVHVVSLGCARTLVDSEGLAGLLEQQGHRISADAHSSDCVVVNTCAFIREAEEESIAAILDLAELKRRGKLRRLYVAGCLPQKRKGEQADLLTLLPEVDGFIGPGDLARLPELIEQQGMSVRPDLIEERNVRGSTGSPPADRFFVTSPVPTLLFESSTPKHRLTPPHLAYLKISEGCDHACSFCSIPQYRGPHRSRSIEDLVREAERLASEGVVELNLIGQDTSFYGKDRTGRLALPELLRALDRVEGIRWIRLLYAHPAHVTGELIAALRDGRRIVKYIDLPLQHISDPLLAAMRRETDGRTIRDLILRLRRKVPGLAIRTAFIIGFPGETESQVEELARFLQETRFERVGMFPYSPEPKTAAERMPNPVSDEAKQDRLDRLMRLQRDIAEEIHQGWFGREMDVLVEEPVRASTSSARTETAVRPELVEGRRVYLGRTYADAPEVDGQVFLSGASDLSPGRMVRARITDTTEYDLVAEAVE